MLIFARLRALATGTVLAVVVFSLAGFASQASAAGAYYPSGPQVDVPRATVESGGWTLCWDESFDQSSDVTNIIAGTDDHSLAPCTSTRLLITGWAVETPETLLLLAAAPRADIFTETSVDLGTGNGASHLSNGTWWVFSPGYSLGFGPNSDLSQTPGEHNRSDGSDSKRMSWHMFADDEVTRTTVLRWGWSIGGHEFAGNTYHRAIYSESMPTVVAAAPLPNTGVDAPTSWVIGAITVLLGAVVLLAGRRRRSKIEG